MKRLFIIIGVTLIIIAFSLNYTGLTIKKHIDIERLAKCLREKNVIMYGSKYCPHCTQQKEMFRDAFKYINYVECTEERERCSNIGIKGVPTWIINGKMYEGVQSLEKLTQISGCE